MPGIILHLPVIKVFQPPGDHAGSDLLRAFDLQVCLLQSFKHMQKTVFDVLRAVDTDKKLVF
jgi:hypothetical protein